MLDFKNQDVHVSMSIKAKAPFLYPLTGSIKYTMKYVFKLRLLVHMFGKPSRRQSLVAMLFRVHVPKDSYHLG